MVNMKLWKHSKKEINIAFLNNLHQTMINKHDEDRHHIFCKSSGIKTARKELTEYMKHLQRFSLWDQSGQSWPILTN